MEENPTPEPGNEPDPRLDENGLPVWDEEWWQAWREMSMEEQDESLAQMLAALKEHRQQIEAKFPDVDVEGVIAQLAERLEEGRGRTAQVRETEEAYLQAVANVADAEANLMVRIAELMKRAENFTEEQWEAMPLATRVEMMNRLNEWNAGRKAEVLAQLPIELRRRIE